MHLATGLAEGLDAAYESRVRSEEEHVRLGVPSLLGRPASRLRLAAAVDGIVGEAAKRGLERVDRGAMLQEEMNPMLSWQVDDEQLALYGHRNPEGMAWDAEGNMY